MTTRANAPSITEESVRQLSQRHNEPEWLLKRRLDAWRAYEAMSMPNPLEEEWRRTDISGLDLEGALTASRVADPTTPDEWRLIEEDLPPGALFCDIHEAILSHETLVQTHLHSLVRSAEWKLASLQAALWVSGAFLYVPQGIEVRLPLTYWPASADAPLFPHLLVVAEAGSRVTVIQNGSSHLKSVAPQALVSGAVEIIAGRDAQVSFIDQQFWAPNVYNFSTIRARLDAGAEFKAGLVGLGGLLSKTKLEVTLAGEGSRAELLGLAFGDGKQHFDYVTLQDHIAPRTVSDLLFKAALDGESSAVWTGTVRIQKGASASEANQTSRNLLLSEHAKAAPIPVLEIEAYDVLRCSHGATAGPLDEDQRFYLQSRGIPPAEAQVLLVEAFFREVLDRLPAGLDREVLDQEIAAKIGAAV